MAVEEKARLDLDAALLQGVSHGIHHLLHIISCKPKLASIYIQPIHKVKGEHWTIQKTGTSFGVDGLNVTMVLCAVKEQDGDKRLEYRAW